MLPSLKVKVYTIYFGFSTTLWVKQVQVFIVDNFLRRREIAQACKRKYLIILTIHSLE